MPAGSILPAPPPPAGAARSVYSMLAMYDDVVFEDMVRADTAGMVMGKVRAGARVSGRHKGRVAAPCASVHVDALGWHHGRNTPRVWGLVP